VAAVGYSGRVEGAAMSMFDNILGNLDELAGKLGLPADQLQNVVQSVREKMAGGGDIMSALTQSAQEHGISLDKLQGLLGGAGADAQDLIGKLTGALDKDGDGNPLNDLGSLAKGLFSRD
jgi:hypothetical protein